MQDQKTLDNVLTLNNPSGPIILEEGNSWHQVLLNYTELPENFPQSLENFKPKTKIFVFFSQDWIGSHGLLLSKFLSHINYKALEAQCQNVTLITSPQDIQKIERGDLQGLINWFSRVRKNPMMNPLFMTDNRLLCLFSQEIINCGLSMDRYYDVVYLMYVSSQLSENFLPYLIQERESNHFHTELRLAINKYNKLKSKFITRICEKLQQISGLPDLNLSQSQMTDMLGKLLSYMRTLPRLSPMFEERKSEEDSSLLPTLVCSGDESDKENKPEENRGPINTTCSSNKRPSPSEDLGSPEGAKRLHMGC